MYVPRPHTLLSLPSTYACKCICICICDYDCICICVTGNSRKHKSQICRMPHGDTQPTGVQGHRGGGGAKVDRRGVSGDFCRVPLVSKARPGARGVRRQVIGSGIHISMARRHLATHSHVTHAPPPRSIPSPTSGLAIGADSTNR